MDIQQDTSQLTNIQPPTLDDVAGVGIFRELFLSPGMCGFSGLAGVAFFLDLRLREELPYRESSDSVPPLISWLESSWVLPS